MPILSSDLVSEFVKVTKGDTQAKKETFVYGKLVENPNDASKYYVQIDGSKTITPVARFTATVNPDERVIVMIKNHSAVITGNITTASATTQYVDDKINELNSIDPEFIAALWQ